MKDYDSMELNFATLKKLKPQVELYRFIGSRVELLGVVEKITNNIVILSDGTELLHDDTVSPPYDNVYSFKEPRFFYDVTDKLFIQKGIDKE